MTVPIADAAAVSRSYPPRELLHRLRADGAAALTMLARDVAEADRAEATIVAGELKKRGFVALMIGDEDYPTRLLDIPRPPALLFASGNLALLANPSVGMCGSRDASETGLRAAHLCGVTAARAGIVVVSGNARGVDTEAHSGALEAGGSTVFVLAEGPLRYRPKSALGENADRDRTLVLSQFPPAATWNVGNAMTRNAVIAGLGEALVVIEARGDGGTLNAGLQALDMGRPVLALDFETSETPVGNQVLHRRGAIPVRSPAALVATIEHVRESWHANKQLALPIDG